MKNISVLLQQDYYKALHYRMYPKGTNMVYSNLTPRKSRMPGVNYAVFFGLQYFLKEYLIKQWDESFFKKPWNEVGPPYQKFMDATLGKGNVTLDHIKELHDLGYLPLLIKALPEGTKVPIRVPMLTIRNTVDHAYWLTNFLETILSTTIWQPCTSATVSAEYKKICNKYFDETVGNRDMTKFFQHDFSMRGLSSLESACLSGAGHLLSYVGSDSIPAIQFLQDYYNADVEKELVGTSVAATEHAIQCMGTKEDELGTYSRLMDEFPNGILSIVSDTWSLPKVVAEILPKLKEKILSRNGTIVIRPDSFWTNPEDCICGFDGYHPRMQELNEAERTMVRKGLVESLWDIFGGTVTPKGYKVLDSHLNTLYGEAITHERQATIYERLKQKGFSALTSLQGVGSYGFQMRTRDSLGFALKATYGEVDGVGREIFKDPVTDDGMKKSAKGLLRVDKVGNDYILKDQCTWEEEAGGELKPVFENGKLLVDWTLQQVRENLAKYE